MAKLLGLLVLLLLISCSEQVSDFFVLTTEKDIFPEGIAVNGDNVFVSSILKNKILKYDLKKKKVGDFIYSNQFGFGSGVGLFLKDSLLYALANADKSSLFVFNINNNTLLKKYQLNDTQTHFWNDLVVSKDNHIYITDTQQDKIFKIRYPADIIEDFFQDSVNIKFPNGITMTDDESKLFIASATSGIRIVDLKMKKVLNLPSKETTGIDGMKYLDNKIYAIVNISRDRKKHRLIQVNLINNNEAIGRIDTLLYANNLMNVPTTVDIKENCIYILANSQLDNLNQTEMKVIDRNRQTDTYIIRIKLKKGG